jgi:hypothetical protein
LQNCDAPKSSECPRRPLDMAQNKREPAPPDTTTQP